ncbi:hypothetical protein ACVWWH_003848 [Sinomonas sp. RB5]
MGRTQWLLRPLMNPIGRVYEDIVRRVADTKARGTTRQRFNVDTWEPALHAHSPNGPLIGDPCSQCGEPWPCRFLLNLLDSGIIGGRKPLP